MKVLWYYPQRHVRLVHGSLSGRREESIGAERAEELHRRGGARRREQVQVRDGPGEAAHDASDEAVHDRRRAEGADDSGAFY